jgi:outer membrane protein TolC
MNSFSKLKMVFIILTAISFLFHHSSVCQHIDYNRIILPDNAQNIDDLERLVQLAWRNHPQNQILTNRVDIARENVRVTRGTWAEGLKITGGINEFMISEPVNQTLVGRMFPAYQVGLEIPLSVFSYKRTRAAEMMVMNEELAINARKLEIRALVAENYQNYRFNQQALQIQTEVTENASNTFALIEDRFKSGEASLSEYNNAFNNYKSEQLRRATAQRNLELAKIQLERMVGVDLNSVLVEQ